MDPPVVYIEKEPFSNMLLAAVDPFRRECFGYVFGHKYKNQYLISNAIVVQSTIRPKEFTEIDHAKRSQKRMLKIFESYPRLYPLIGDFHSHAEYGLDPRSVELSDTDIQGMIDEFEKMDLAIVIRISSRNRERLEWISKPDGGVRGSYGDYAVDVNIYRLVNDSGQLIPQSLRIETTAIKALNRLNNNKKKR